MATMVAPGITTCATAPGGRDPTNPLVDRGVVSLTAPGKVGGTTSNAVGTATGKISSASKTGGAGGGGGGAAQTNALTAAQLAPLTSVPLLPFPVAPAVVPRRLHPGASSRPGQPHCPRDRPSGWSRSGPPC